MNLDRNRRSFRKRYETDLLVGIHGQSNGVGFDDLKWPWKAGRQEPIFRRISVRMLGKFGTVRVRRGVCF